MLHHNEAIAIEYTAAYLQYLGDKIDIWTTANNVTLTSAQRDSLIAQGYKSGWGGGFGIGDQLNAGLSRGADPQQLAVGFSETGRAYDRPHLETSATGYMWSVFAPERVEKTSAIFGLYNPPMLYVPQ